MRYTGNDVVDNWLNENVAYWVYVFIDPTKFYYVSELKAAGQVTTMKQMDGGRDVYADLDRDYGKIRYPIGFNGATNCIAYPIYKNATTNSNVIKIHTSIIDFIPNESGREYFENHNAESSYYYSIKISVVPPFTSFDGISIDNNNCLVINASVKDGANGKLIAILNNGKTGAICLNTNTSQVGLFYGCSQDNTILPLFNYSLPENNSVKKADITKPQTPNLKYNPKLNGQNFKELVITASSGDTFAYDIQKLNGSSIAFEYSEPIQPEVTKYCLRVQGGTGLYEDGTDENYTGLVGSTDNSLAYTNDQYAAFIANNKNFFLQSNMKIVSNAAQSAIGIADSVGSGNYDAARSDFLSAGINTATAVIDRDLTIDNLKATPDQLKNANGNVIFNMFVAELGLYVEKHSALEGDLKTANDFMNIYGFSFSGIANVKDYANIHKYHNYIKAQLQSINGNLSNTARVDLRQRFASGVRFWNQDKVAYEYENYENWLDSGANSFEDWLENKNIPLGS